MPTYAVTTTESVDEVTADYYTSEEGFLTFKDEKHKQVASFNDNYVVSVLRIAPKPTAIGTATVTIIPQLDQAAFESAVKEAVEKAERAMRHRA